MSHRSLKRRWWAKLRADVGGYFWMPCPCCGQMFGGQESSNGFVGVGNLMMITCPACPDARGEPCVE